MLWMAGRADLKTVIACRELQLQGEKLRAETNLVHHAKLNLRVY